MNLAEHFFQDQYAFVSYRELGEWCVLNGVTSHQEKLELLKCLIESMGGRKISIQWHGKGAEPALMHLGLYDTRCWLDKEFWGKGVTIIDLQTR